MGRGGSARSVVVERKEPRVWRGLQSARKGGGKCRMNGLPGPEIGHNTVGCPPPTSPGPALGVRMRPLPFNFSSRLLMTVPTVTCRIRPPLQKLLVPETRIVMGLRFVVARAIRSWSRVCEVWYAEADSEREESESEVCSEAGAVPRPFLVFLELRQLERERPVRLRVRLLVDGHGRGR